MATAFGVDNVFKTVHGSSVSWDSREAKDRGRPQRPKLLINRAAKAPSERGDDPQPAPRADIWFAHPVVGYAAFNGRL